MRFILTRTPIGVVIVDDHAEFVRLMKRILEKYPNVEVQDVVQQVDQILARVRVLQPEVIILDIDMPTLLDRQMIAKMKQAAPQASLIAVTLLDEEIDGSFSHVPGLDICLSKRDLSTQLPAVVSGLLQA